MATYKATMILSGVTGDQADGPGLQTESGWSESWYKDGTLAQVRTAMEVDNGLAQRRANLFPQNYLVAGLRYTQVVPPGASISIDKVFPGQLEVASDFPNLAYKFRVLASNLLNSRSVILRSVPDAAVVFGRYKPSVNRDTALTNFQSELAGWQFKAQDLSFNTFKILSINNTGLVTTKLPSGIAPGQEVTILRSHNSTTTALVHGIFGVLAVPSATTIQLAGDWTLGACVGGTIRRYAIIYPSIQFTEYVTPNITSKKVGRPFDLFRGRAAVRR